MEKAFAGIFGGTARLRLGAHGKGRNFGPGLERLGFPGDKQEHAALWPAGSQSPTWHLDEICDLFRLIMQAVQPLVLTVWL